MKHTIICCGCGQLTSVCNSAKELTNYLSQYKWVVRGKHHYCPDCRANTVLVAKKIKRLGMKLLQLLCITFNVIPVQLEHVLIRVESTLCIMLTILGGLIMVKIFVPRVSKILKKGGLMFLLLHKAGQIQQTAYRVNSDNIKQYYPDPLGTRVDFLDGSQSLTVTEEPNVFDEILETVDVTVCAEKSKVHSPLQGASQKQTRV